MITSTRTHATYFDHKAVDALVGQAYEELNADYQSRKPYIDVDVREAIEARLAALHCVWTMMLEYT